MPPRREAHQEKPIPPTLMADPTDRNIGETLRKSQTNCLTKRGDGVGKQLGEQTEKVGNQFGLTHSLGWNLRLTIFTQVLDAGRPIKQELKKNPLTQTKEVKLQTKKKQATRISSSIYRKRGQDNSTQIVNPCAPQVRELAKQFNLCLNCLKSDHQIKDCP